MRLKPVPGLRGGYYISDQGTVFRANRDGLAVESSAVVRDGCVRIQNRKYRLADLVLLAFIGPRPFGHRVTYRDGNRSNVNLSNLEYVWRDA